MESKDELRLYSLSEAAKFLGISRMTLSNLIDCGKIDFINSPTGKRKQFTEKILRNIQDIQDVRDMAEAAGLSPRQLQRTLKRTTNFTPHDLLKVLRLQQSFKRHYLDFYSDQAHYIHSFRKITGYTPEKFKKKFDV